VEKLHTFPWPHLVVDHFLPSEVLTESLRTIGSNNYEFEIENRGTGRIEFSLLRCEALWRAVYSKRTISLLGHAFEVDVSLNKHNLLQLRRMNDQTPDFPMHHDHVSDASTIASFLYISPGWSEEHGGLFNLFEAKEQLTPSLSISPVQNRLLAFRTEPCHWHSVDRVHGWERLSVLALWDIA
jgi:2OG-Fe(II) oxygenase superfamily